MRTALLAVVAVILLSCGDDKPARDNRPNPPDFASDRADSDVDRTIDAGAADAR